MGMHIGHLALIVEDLDGYVRQIQAALGLRIVEQDADGALLTSNEKHHELELRRGGRSGFDHVGLEVDSAEELDAAVTRAVNAGATVASEPDPEPGLQRVVRIVDPIGLTYQLSTTMDHEGLSPHRHLGSGIRRFGHATFVTPKRDELVAFWSDGLGFRISDEADGFTWMRCDPLHHSLAVGPHAEATLLHHHAWEVQDVAALAKYCDEAALAGVRQSWGPVRHGPGFNISTYALDQAGALIEVYTDLVSVTDEGSYTPVDWSQHPGSFNLWGPEPTDDVATAGIPVLGGATPSAAN
jgi:catechol 2,3-dioxygenase-like lactoylglutathione lyase family enzyme